MKTTMVINEDMNNLVDAIYEMKKAFYSLTEDIRFSNGKLAVLKAAKHRSEQFDDAAKKVGSILDRLGADDQDSDPD